MDTDITGNKPSNKFLEGAGSSKNKYGIRYIQIPATFYKEHSKYGNLSEQAKSIYGLYYTRLQVSIKNQRVDQNGEYYFTYTDKKLTRNVHPCLRQIQKYKKELVDHRLLRQKKVGKNQPDRLYLLKPDVDEEDLYLKKGIAKNASREFKTRLAKKPVQRPYNLKKSKNNSKNYSKSPLNTGKAKIASEIDKDNNKTNRYIRYKQKNFKSERQKNKQKPLEENITFKSKTIIKEKPKPTIFNTSKLNFPSFISLNNNKKFHFFKIIFQARNQVAKKTGTKIKIENHYRQLNQAISRFQTKLLSGQIQNKKAYLYSTCQNCFTDCMPFKTKTKPHYPRVKKICYKEKPDKIGADKKIKKTSNKKAKKAYLDFKKTINLGK